MPRLIDRLPISSLERTVALPSGGTAVIKPLQPVVWISVAPPYGPDAVRPSIFQQSSTRASIKLY